MKTIDGYDVKVFTDNIEDSALEQIQTLLSIDVFSDKKIRVMPDVHAGAGCVIGFTGDLGDTVSIYTFIRPIFNFKASNSNLKKPSFPLNFGGLSAVLILQED